MKVHGACHCGAITYEAEVDPRWTTICHCNDCQALSGTAYRVSVPARVEDFKWLTGTPTLYAKRGDSGATRLQAFCPVCGSPIHSSAAENATFVALRTGGLAERASLVPSREIWCRSALAWTRDPDLSTEKLDRE